MSSTCTLHFRLVCGLLLESFHQSDNIYVRFLIRLGFRDLSCFIELSSWSKSSTTGYSASTTKPGKLPCILGRIGTAIVGSAFSGIMTNSVTFEASDSISQALVPEMSHIAIIKLDCIISRIQWFGTVMASKCTRLLS